MNNMQLDNVVESLLDGDNQRRTQAQNFINQLPQTNFNQGIDGLLMTMNHQKPNVAIMAAVILKKKYVDIKQNFNIISQEKMEWMVSSVQTSMGMNRPLMFLKRCCDILVKIFSFVNQKQHLMDLIHTLAQNGSPNVRLTLMYLIEISCEFAYDDKLLMEYSGALQNIFQMGMQDESNDVRVASFKTLTIFLSSIEDLALVKKFQSVLQILLQKAIELIKYDQQSGITALQSLNELIEAHPKFIKSILGELLMIYTEIMEAKPLLVSLRITSMHGLLLITMNHASLVRKNQFFKSKIVPTYMNLLAQNQSIPIQQWAQELNEQIISKNDISLSVEQHLAHILNELGNKFLLPLFIPHIQKALSSNQPCMQHAGLTSMAILVENCHESFRGQFDNIMGLMAPLLKSQHPRIINDLLVAMGYLSEEFSPQIQTKYGSVILQFITMALAHSYPKVQYRAVQCIQNFQNGLKQHPDIKVMDPFLDTILSHLGTIFEQSFNLNNFLMLEAVLDTISTVASMNSFGKYYISFMPGLKKIISMMNSDSTQKAMIKSKTVETMGYLLSSVKDNEQLFIPDCKQIMQSLIKLTSVLDKDDPIHRATFIVYENVVQCMKGNFVMYSEHVFDRALEAVNRKVECSIVDEGQVEKTAKNKLNQYVKLKIDLKIDGMKNIVLNTDSLQQKLQASNLLSTMSEQMGTSFFPYIQRMLPTVVQLMSFKNSKQIRNNILQIAKHMLMACQTNEQKVFILQSVMPAISKELTTVIRTKAHLQMSNIVEVIAQMMSSMTGDMVESLPSIMMAVLGSVKNLTKEVQKIYGDKDMDEDTQQQMNDEIAQIQEVLEHVETIINKSGGKNEFLSLKQYFPPQYEFQSV